VHALARLPDPLVVGALGTRERRAERHVEAGESAEEHHEILERARVLLVERVMALLDQRAGRPDLVHVLAEEPAEAFARGVEAPGVVETPRQHQEVIECHAHEGGCAKPRRR
jgi:hypothetical protein